MRTDPTRQVDGHDILSYLTSRLIGFPEESLKVILACSFAGGSEATSGGRNILCLAPTGVGKSTVFRLVAKMLRYSFVAYDMSKDDTLSIAGCINFSNLGSSGNELTWLLHPRVADNYDAILADEINRAPKSESSILFEALETRRLYSRPLRCKVFFACANPDGLYSGANRMDLAHIDRFDVLVEASTAEDLSPEELAAIARVNLRSTTAAGHDLSEVPDATGFREQVVREREALLADVTLTSALTDWCGCVVAELLDAKAEKRCYISLRTVGKMANVALDVLAFQSAYDRRSLYPTLIEQVEISARFSLLTKYSLDVASFSKALTAARHHLRRYQEWKLKQEDRLTGLALGSLPDRVAAAEQLVGVHLDPDEQVRMQPLVSQLVTDVAGQIDEHPALASRLWRVCLSYPEEAHTLELRIFRNRLKHLLSSDTRRAKRDLGHAASWSPAEIWT